MEWLKKGFFRIIEGPFNARQEKLLGERATYTKQDFVASFDCDVRISLAVWNRLIKDCSINGFKPHPADELCRVYGLVDEDLDDLVLELLENCNRGRPRQNDLLGREPIKNVKDLVYFISDCSNFWTCTD